MEQRYELLLGDVSIKCRKENDNEGKLKPNNGEQ